MGERSLPAPKLDLSGKRDDSEIASFDVSANSDALE
jgi:hypothetical protein